MAISRFQMNRQLRAYGGIMGQDGRRNYGIGSFFQEKIMDPIKKVVKSPVGKAAAALGGSYLLGRTGGEGIASTNTGFKGILENILGGAKRVGKVVTSDPVKDIVLGPKGGVKDTDPDKRSGGILSSLLTSRVALPIASGLIAGAFTKDKEDPIYTGQDVGLNLQDIAKLANISDPKTASAIGLRFSPDVAARKFTPAEMAETYAANAPQDFTEQRQGAEEGGIIGDQKDFEEFLQDMKNRNTDAMQDQILRDFQEYMRRKMMRDQMLEVKDGGIIKMADGGMMASAVGDESDEISMSMFGKPVKDLNPSEFRELMDYLDNLQKKFMAKGGIASMAEGGMMDMGGMEMDLRGGGFVPMGKAEKADDVPARLSKNEFVFTADAVRAAGGGSVDKGADKMYATMKKLEDKVA